MAKRNTATEETTETTESATEATEKPVDVTKLKALFTEYEGIDSKVEALKQQIEKLNDKRKDLVKKIFEANGENPKIKKSGVLLTIVQRGDNFFFRGHSDKGGVTEI